MDQKTRDTIAKIADTIRETYEISMPITDLHEVVQTLGGRIVETRNAALEGSIQRVEESNCSFVFYLAQQNRKGVWNISVAQMLGHLFLHMGYMTDWERWERKKPILNMIWKHKKEFEANEFAADFLMPSEEYMDKAYELMENGSINATALANYFGVPVGAAINRGKWLGVLKWV